MDFDPTEPFPGICSICSSGFENLKNIYKVPVFDPSEAKDPMAVSGLIGRYFHTDCWRSHELFPAITSLTIKTLDNEFNPEDKIFSNEKISFWCRKKSDYEFQNGALYLSCSSFIFQNIMGADIEGSIIRGHKLELEALISFISNDNLRADLSHNGQEIHIERTEEFNNNFLIKINSNSDFEGYLFLSSTDRSSLATLN